MFGIAILDVVIGMIFIFLLLSLVCSAINEIIEAYMNKRADYLFQGIKDLLDDEKGKGLSAEVYSHPLIAALIQNKKSKKPLRPSYIPARSFALALMDIISEADADNKSGSAGATPAKAAPAQLVLTTSSKIPVMPPAVPPASVEATESLRQAVAKIEHEYVRRALLPLIDAAGNDAAKVRENIENWFNSGMDKVSGWYKRRAQIILLGLGFLVAAFLNADTLTISNKLWHDKPLRDSLVVSAQEAIKNDPREASTAVMAAPPAVKTECEKSEKTKGVCSKECLDNVNLPECRLNTNLKKIEDLGLPIGWGDSNLLSLPTGANFPAWFLAWLTKLLGLLITAFAVSLGAPFWFDLLNKFVVVRSTVKPREKSHEEQSKE